MLHEFSRTELLIGTQSLEKLKKSTVMIFGIGGVGGYALEGLVRSGVGNFIIIDNDDVCITNINRQIIATKNTVGKPKVEVARTRILDINPEVGVTTFQTFYLPGNTDNILDLKCDYIIDAIDTVTAKLDLVMEAGKRNIPIISSMGMGNKLDPTKIEVADIHKTSVCPLARVMRRELKKRGVKSLKVVYSKEEPRVTEFISSNGRHIPGSVSFVPSVAGLVICAEVVKDLIK